MGRDGVGSSVATLGCPGSFRHRKGSNDTSNASAEEVGRKSTMTILELKRTEVGDL